MSNVNGVNSPIKRQSCWMYEKHKTYLCAACKRLTSAVGHTQPESEGTEKDIPCKWKPKKKKKAQLAIFI